MVKFAELPFTDRLVSSHPSLEHREIGEVVLSTIIRATPARILKRHQAEKNQRMLRNTLSLRLRSLYEDSSTNVIQVGAHDGVSDDPLFESLNASEWSALLVEPTKQAFSALEVLRGQRPKTTLVNKAVTPTGESVTLYVPTIDSYGTFGSVWTSTDKLQVEREIKRNLGSHLLKSTEIQTVVMEGISPANLIESNELSPDQVNVLVCDIEGQDPSVIHAFLDAGTQPEILMYEHFHADKSQAREVDLRLLDQGYQLIHSVKDTLAVL